MPAANDPLTADPLTRVQATVALRPPVADTHRMPPSPTPARASSLRVRELQICDRATSTAAVTAYTAGLHPDPLRRAAATQRPII